MLTLLPSNIFPLANAKCGEIYCQSTTRFSILCSFCTIKIKDYNDFIKHIKTTHLTSDPNKSEECAESVSAPFVKVRVKPKDLAVCNPLDDEPITEPPELLSSTIISDHEEVQPIINCEEAQSTLNFTTEENQVVPEENVEQTPVDMLEESVFDNHALSDDNQIMDVITNEKDRLSEVEDEMGDIAEDQTSKVKKKSYRERTLECSKCNKKYAGPSQLHQHIKKVHDKEELPEPLQCPQCARKYNERKKFYHHLINQHGEIPCDKCDKKFDQLHKFKIHYPQHNVERNYVCDFENCNKRFTCHNNLYNHKISHRPLRPYVCDQCGYSAHRIVTLRIHMRIHTGEKPYTCPICQECFRSTSMLASHKLKHFETRAHVCDICNSAYKSRKSLLNHKEVHMNLSLECKLCGQKFKRSSSLKTHMKRHAELG